MSTSPEQPSRRDRLDRLMARAYEPRPLSEDEVISSALEREHMRTDQLVAYAREQLTGRFGSLLGERASREVESHLLSCRTCLEEFAAIEVCVAAELRATGGQRHEGDESRS